MNKKVIFIASAVLAFFAGAIWVSEVPVVATLVAFLEVCAGFVCGFFFSQEIKKELPVKDVEEYSSLRLAVETLKNTLASREQELKSLKEANKAVKEEKTAKPKKKAKAVAE